MAHNNLANAWKQIRQVDKAIEVCRKVASYSTPNPPSSTTLSASCTWTRTNGTRPTLSFKRSSRSTRGLSRYISSIGVIRKAQENCRRRRHASRRPPKFSRLTHWACTPSLAMSAAQGSGAQAEEAYQKAVELKPVTAETFYQLGHVLRQLGKKADAAKAWQKAARPLRSILPRHTGICRSTSATRDVSLSLWPRSSAPRNAASSTRVGPKACTGPSGWSILTPSCPGCYGGGQARRCR